VWSAARQSRQDNIARPAAELTVRAPQPRVALIKQNRIMLRLDGVALPGTKIFAKMTDFFL